MPVRPITSRIASAANDATAARTNYAEVLKKSLATNKALNPQAANNQLPTAGNIGTPAQSSTTVQTQQLKNLEGQTASERTTQLYQEAANKRRAAMQPQQVATRGSSGGVRVPAGSQGAYNQASANYQVGDSNSARSTLVRNAMSLIGTGYAWGGGGYGNRSSRGTGLGTQNVIGVDCSGLTSYAYSTIGVRIPRTAAGQKTIGYKTSVANLRPGDLVVWASGKHTSMYIGNGMIVESPKPGSTVRTRRLTGREPVVGVHLSLSGD